MLRRTSFPLVGLPVGRPVGVVGDNRMPDADPNATPDSMETSNQPPRSAEMFAGPGFRVRTDVERADSAVVERLRPFPTPDVSDLMNRLYTMATTIRNVTGPELRLVGPACTV